MNGCIIGQSSATHGVLRQDAHFNSTLHALTNGCSQIAAVRVQAGPAGNDCLCSNNGVPSSKLDCMKAHGQPIKDDQLPAGYLPNPCHNLDGFQGL